MNRIVHLALKVEDLERTTEFYQKVFGFVEMNTEKVRDHTSRHLSDGVLDIALIKYDPGTQSAESKAAGEGPCIHHFAVEVEDVSKATEQ
ncbi:MAG TPA: VOC family protein, partial [Burkholderiales bacterium]|nr:VOC family protein [Burkholderiales bacterium]